MFNQYIIREGLLQPLFATFCDGRVSQCDGLLQWGTNGVYDEPTQRAVIAFQTMQGIEPTGLIDEITWNTIVEVYRKQRYGSVAGVSPI